MVRNLYITSFIALIIAPAVVNAAASDEIQVYDDAINKPKELSLDLHAIYVSSGVTTPSYSGDIPANHMLRLTPELAYGINENWEAGLYLPVIRTATADWYGEGVKVRLKYMATHAETGYYWGVNAEIGAVSQRTEEETWNGEIRPIMGIKTTEWNLTINPIIGFAISGSEHNPDFSPAFKISRQITSKTWVSLEHYSEFGPLHELHSQQQESFLTVDTEIFGHDINIGIGHGWTDTSNDWTIKAIINFQLSDTK